MYKAIILVISLLLCFGCDKEWIRTTPDESKLVPKELADFKLLFDNYEKYHSTAAAGEVGSDNYYIPSNILTAMIPQYQARYIWAANGWGEKDQWDWSKPYASIYVANLAITGLEKIERTDANKADWDYVKGTAHYLRSAHYFNLASVFTFPSDSALGIPLILKPDPNAPKGRGTVNELYKQIDEDLQAALNYLPDVNTSQYKFRPSKQAAYALLARIRLALEDYKAAFNYADTVLRTSNYLLDYNLLSTAANISFPNGNSNNEIIYLSQFLTNILVQANIAVDSNLLASYTANDLRKDLFFRSKFGRMVFAGNYTGDVRYLFSGIATDEIYLIRAESNARLNKIAESMADLNTLMVKRYNKNSFTSFTASTQDQALRIILAERRKELIFRGTRWTDLRRLNRDLRFPVTITRNLNGVAYTLKPGDNKYAFPIPELELADNMIEQNPR